MSELVVRSETGVAELPAGVTFGTNGLVISADVTEEDLARVVAGFEALDDASCFAVGDVALAYKAKNPVSWRTWIEGLPKQDPQRGTLDQKTVRSYMAVAAFYPHDFRARYRTSEGGRRVLSFSHFARVKPFGLESAATYLEQAAVQGLNLEQLGSLIDAGPPGADELPAPPEVPASVFGEAYWLGPEHDPQRHLLVCGDSTRPEHVAFLQHMGRAVDIVWTDPPYGVDIGEKNAWLNANSIGSSVRIESDLAGDTAPEVRALLRDAFLAVTPYLKESCPVYVAGPSGAQAEDFIAVWKDVSWRFRSMLVWIKNVMVIGRTDYHGKHETIFYGYGPGGRAGRMAQATDRDGAAGTSVNWYGSDSETTVFDVPRPRKSGDHPTMKPVKLIVEMLQNSSQEGDLVVDMFGGSGSTLIAAEQTGRRAFLIEYDRRYADVIRQRYADFLESQRKYREEAAAAEAAAVAVLPVLDAGPSVFEE